ncbi:rhomboid family intramembrane serine protease [Paracoccus sp. Ld10]|uniref:rhomboid family intramembrane serine protease n=1 Tax=Paracoccus sp. Ld10 TaxID=649158 RepID=UPI00386FCA3F
MDRPVAIPRVSAARRPEPATLPLWLRVVIVTCCVIEAVCFAAPMLGIGSARTASVMLGGFWAPLVGGGVGLYPGQGIAMFLTYGLLHSGLLHLAMNMISLAAVGRELVRMIGSARMAATYLVSQIAAAAVFAAMEPGAGPMVGASGAVFGLAGALVGYAAITLRRRRRSMSPLVRSVGLILGLNVALTLLMPSIAWQAHLGGGVAGLVLGVAFALIPRR